MRKLHALFAPIVLAVPLAVLPGCAGCTLATVLPTVIEVITDASLILQTIETFVNAFFAKRPDPALQQKIADALNKARLTLVTAGHLADGLSDANDGRVGAAFSDFKAAYVALLDLIVPLGVRQGGSLQVAPDALGAPAGLVVPRPRALTLTPLARKP